MSELNFALRLLFSPKFLIRSFLHRRFSDIFFLDSERFFCVSALQSFLTVMKSENNPVQGDLF